MDFAMLHSGSRISVAVDLTSDEMAARVAVILDRLAENLATSMAVD
jgi:hypothetical protein